MAKGFEKYALDWADAITVSSHELYDHYTKMGYTVHYLPNAMDISSLPTGIDRRYEKQIVYAARMSREKGIMDILPDSLKNSLKIFIYYFWEVVLKKRL